MLGALCILLLLQGTGFFLFLRWLTLHLSQKHQEALIFMAQRSAEENTRMAMLADNAMGHLKSETLEKKVRADSIKKQYDIQLEYMKDSMTKQVVDETKRKRAKAEPRWAMTDQGKRIDLNDVEFLE